jgi:hypothetical protein
LPQSKCSTDADNLSLTGQNTIKSLDLLVVAADNSLV